VIAWCVTQPELTSALVALRNETTTKTVMNVHVAPFGLAASVLTRMLERVRDLNDARTVARLLDSLATDKVCVGVVMMCV
jgi:hypothetical protein